jgi:hypothetical protein
MDNHLLLQRCKETRDHLADVASKLAFFREAVVVDMEHDIKDLVFMCINVSCIMPPGFFLAAGLHGSLMEEQGGDTKDYLRSYGKGIDRATQMAAENKK